ncbi:MAG: glutamine synthetase family protein [Rhizomicrobium sp.]
MNKPAAVPDFARPAFVAAAQAEFELLSLEHPDLLYVDAVLPDAFSILRGKRLPISEASRLFESGMQIPRTLYLMDAHGEMTNPFGRGFGDGDPDGTAWPIPGTAAPVWGEGPKRAQVLMTLRDGHGVAEASEPRAALERVAARFYDARLTPVAALELEFYLIDGERDSHGAPMPPINPRNGAREKAASVYGIDDLDRYQAFLGALNEAAVLQRVPISATSKEYAPGQFEANLRHQSDVCAAADHAIMLKQIVKAAARAQGYEATFMAKPYPDRTGSGLHVHVSVLDEDGRNIFDDGTEQGSPRLGHAIGGLQALMVQSMALFAPNINSYRRFQPDMFAPVNRRWGVNNRSAGLRVPMGPCEARRVEHRCAGADANPYYALAAVLAGIHHGLEQTIDPGPPAVGNVSREPDAALPFTIDEALLQLAKADKLASYLGEETLALYRETKRIETARLRRVISAAEYDWYL